MTRPTILTPRRAAPAVALALLAALGACSAPGEYPMSGDDCGPGDPVLEMPIADCAPPASGGGM